MGTFSKSYRTYVSLDKKCFSSIQALYVSSIRFSLLTKPNPSHTHKKMSTYIPSKVESTWEKTDPNTETEKLYLFTFIKFMFSKKDTKIDQIFTVDLTFTQ